MGQVAVDVPWTRGVTLVTEHEDSEKLKNYASVGEAIIMNLGRSTAVAATSLAIADVPKVLSASQRKRAIRKKETGAHKYHEVNAAGKFIIYLKHAHAATVKLPTDYYGSSIGFGMWSVPESFNGFDENRRFKLHP